MTEAPNHALQRTPGFGVQLLSAALVRPAQSRAVRPAMKPGTARAFASRRRAHMRAPGPESLSLGSLGASTLSVMFHSMRIITVISILFAFHATSRAADPVQALSEARKQYEAS